MIAQVYPIKRLPPSMVVFDYLVPEAMNIGRGDMVEVPFRNTVIFGVVRACVDKPSTLFPLKTVSRVLARLTETELRFYEIVADELDQSPASVLNAAIPLPPKRSTFPPLSSPPLLLKKESGMDIGGAIFTSAVTRFICSSTMRKSVRVIAKYRKQNPNSAILVIAPNVLDAERVRDRLAAFHPFFVSGDESTNARFESWTKFRESTDGLLIGTRLAALMTHPNLKAIFILRSSHANHFQADQNPKYDTRRLSEIHQTLSGCERVLFDVLPRMEEVFNIPLEHISYSTNQTPATIVAMNKERPVSQNAFIGLMTADKMTKTLASGKRVLCAYNKKGIARSLRCGDCGETMPAIPPLPLSCPACKGVHLVKRGIGNKTLAALLQRMFPSRSVAIIDKDTPPTETRADILLCTRFYFEHVFNPFAPDESIGLVCDLDADTGLYHPTKHALEQTLIAAKEWHGLAESHQAPFLLQTDMPELFSKYLADPISTLKNEREAQDAYRLT